MTIGKRSTIQIGEESDLVHRNETFFASSHRLRSHSAATSPRQISQTTSSSDDYTGESTDDSSEVVESEGSRKARTFSPRMRWKHKSRYEQQIVEMKCCCCFLVFFCIEWSRDVLECSHI